MTAAYRSGSATNAFAYTSATVTVTKPTGAAEGDKLVVALINNDGSRTLDTIPSGFSLISNTGTTSTKQTRMWVLEKTCGASEGASWDFVFNDTFNGPWLAVAIQDAGDVNISGAAAVSGIQGTPYSMNAPSVTTTVADTLLLWVGGLCFTTSGVDPVLTQPSGFTTIGEAAVDYDQRAVFMATKAQASAGSSGAANGSAAVTGGGDGRTHAVLIAIETAVTTYVGRPASDVSAGTWTASSGSDLYAMLDEETASDADYVTASSAGTCEVALSTFASPPSGWVTTVRYRIQGDCTVSLREGATEIASWTHSPGPGTPTTYEQALTSGQQASITDWSALRLRFVKP